MGELNRTPSQDVSVGVLLLLVLALVLSIIAMVLLIGVYLNVGTKFIATNATNMTNTANVTNAINATEEGSYWVPYVPTDEDEATSDDDWVILPIIINTPYPLPH